MKMGHVAWESSGRYGGASLGFCRESGGQRFCYRGWWCFSERLGDIFLGGIGFS